VGLDQRSVQVTIYQQVVTAARAASRTSTTAACTRSGCGGTPA